MKTFNGMPCYQRRPLSRSVSSYREETVYKSKKSIGTLIRTHLLRPRDIKALRTITEGEPSDKVPNWNSGAFSALSDPFAPPVSELIFPEEKQE